MFDKDKLGLGPWTVLVNLPDLFGRVAGWLAGLNLAGSARLPAQPFGRVVMSTSRLTSLLRSHNSRKFQTAEQADAGKKNGSDMMPHDAHATRAGGLVLVLSHNTNAVR